MSITRDNNDKVILQERNYYPFGLLHQGYNEEKHEIKYTEQEEDKIFTPQVVAGHYKYWYQEQERQTDLDLNWDSFKYRNYDYAIGRFMSVDPLAEKYPYNGVYNFSENAVISYRELEGLEKVLAISFYGGNDPGSTDYRLQLLQTLSNEDIDTQLLTNNPGEQLRDAFVSASQSDENGIGFVAIWGHGTPNYMWGANSEVLTRDDLKPLAEAVQNDEINFSENAIIYLGNCNAGTNGNDGQSFAQALANITGVRVVAGSTDNYGERPHRGSVGVVSEIANVEMVYSMWFPTLDNFRLFQANQAPQNLGGQIEVGRLMQAGTLQPVSTDLNLPEPELENPYQLPEINFE